MGEILKELRTERGLTQEEVGKIIGVQKAAIQKYEKGDVKNLKRSAIRKLSEFYNVSPTYLMGLGDKQDKQDNLDKLDKQVKEYLEMLENRPELKMIFNVTKNATKEDIEKVVKIIETNLGK